MSEVSAEENHVDESPRGIAVMVVVGVLVGLLSGLFGIGGGTIIVPALVWLGLTQRHAAATSMLAIIPTSVSGVLSYAVNGNVDWIAALLVFVGMVHAKVGLIIGIVAALTAPLGTWIAEAMTPRTGEILFATYLTVLLIRSVWVALKITRK